ncbi:hypothetical protein HHK36_022586 [Tetracentron sinense]|uniref:Cellulose synthase-like protein G2 n=1 Tax=Tetracentron sinense TaxID=13715 RepID=A0A834YN34_TETSI|nr:hypothetical protein HHK36_022586 [Tetracentron sinense]
MEVLGREERSRLPYHVSQVQQPRATINRLHALFHSMAILALLYYRASRLFGGTQNSPMSAWLIVFASEIVFSFLWILGTAFRWRPMSRTVFPERLPPDEELPAIDVFICTANPEKEPTVEVMNTVLSAMSLDYPPEKLSVYLSDDAGSPITLYAMEEAYSFAMSWIPFCRKYGVETRCPEVYLSSSAHDHPQHSTTEFFMEEWDKIKSLYQLFKERVEKRASESDGTGGRSIILSRDHPPLIKVINGTRMDAPGVEQAKMPLLVYVAREKRPLYPHHFKAGALNVLLRVSGIISNAPCILVLDCDMYCNDPTSARQAMCFHLDPQNSHSLAFVQFPQSFHNISCNDIYDGGMQWVFKVLWPGLNGLKGPMLSGTGFYIKREALYGRSTMRQDIDVLKLRLYFGLSNEFIASLRQNYKYIIDNGVPTDALLEEAVFLASCAYEKETIWGEQASPIGFMYHSVVEDYTTGFHLHCKGWTSVYCHPSKPSFLGSSPINLNDTIVQNKRWGSGLLQVGFSRFCPLTYGLLRMPILQCMCYGYVALLPLSSFPILCYGIIPQLCLLNGISLYPKVSNPWFLVFSLVYLSSLFRHLFEVLSTGGSFGRWWIEQRMWMTRSATSYFFAFLSTIMKFISASEVDFELTNKVIDTKKIERYKAGKYDFESATLLLLPLTTIVILNMVSFIGGVGRVIFLNSYNELLGQLFLSFFILVMGFPIVEAMVMTKEKGSIPTSTTFISAIFSIVLVSLGFILFT